MPATPAPKPLFDPDHTGPTVCAHCQAIRYPNQHRAITCAHDLNPETRRRPNGCLNTYQPEHQEIPY